MRKFDMFETFARAEDGAVTVDWVVLTGALVGLGLATVAVTSNGVESLGEETSASLVAMEVGPTFGLPGWSSGTPLHFSQEQWDSNRDFFATRDDAINAFGANEALTIAEAGGPDTLYQIDQAGATIDALNQNGYDTAELQDRYDALYAEHGG